MTGEAADLADLEAGRLLFARECVFVAGATSTEVMPPARLPELAFAGRSNVGKSSLVNALTGRQTLARISKAPGRTQQLNFFALDDRLMLVIGAEEYRPPVVERRLLWERVKPRAELKGTKD